MFQDTLSQELFRSQLTMGEITLESFGITFVGERILGVLSRIDPDHLLAGQGVALGEAEIDDTENLIAAIGQIKISGDVERNRDSGDAQTRFRHNILDKIVPKTLGIGETISGEIPERMGNFTELMLD